MKSRKKRFKMDAICIANKHAEILYFTRFNHNVERNVFDKFLSKITYSGETQSPVMVEGDTAFVYIFQDDMYWCSCLSTSSFLYSCGLLFVAENLSDFYKLCVALIGTITQHSIKANMILIQEIVMETMIGGYMQMQSVDKIRSQILSRVEAPKESAIQSLTPGLFGVEKTAPTTASQQSLLSLENRKKEVFVDVVEKVWATVSVEGTLLRAEVSGTVVLHCFLLHFPTLYLTFNTDLSTIPKEGYNPQIQLSEIEFGHNLDISQLSTKKELRVVANPGESLLFRYSLPPSIPHTLPFTLSATHKQVTHSDVELKLKLSSTTGMEAVAPKVVVRLVAPPLTTTIMSRTNGPRDQSVVFTSAQKLITWTITDFPGGSYAQAFIRLVDAGENAIIESAVLEFEVSKWVSSGLHIDKVRLEPRNLKSDKWVRYLTTSESVTFKFR